MLYSYPALIADINLKGFEEKSNAFAFIIEFMVLSVSVVCAIHLCFFSLSFFIFFSSYIVAQLELVALLVEQLALDDSALLARQLGEITTIHLDALE